MRVYDVVVAGGGAVGMLAALALSQQGFNVALVCGKGRPNRPKSGVSLVLNHHSVEALDALGVDISLLKNIPITSCMVSAKGHYGRIRFQADDIGSNALGLVVKADLLDTLLTDLLKASPVVQYSGAQVTQVSSINATTKHIVFTRSNVAQSISCTLLLACDGIHSICRQQLGISVKKGIVDYACMITPVELNRSHNNRAIQRLLVPGTCAFIPGDGCSGKMVWTLPKHKIAARQSLSNMQLVRLLERDAVTEMGGIKTILSDPYVYPITMQRSLVLAQNNAVLLGNAASSVLPITAGGLNLAIRDVAYLASMLSKSTPLVWGAEQVDQYHANRLRDHTKTYCTVTQLVHVFARRNVVFNMVRSMGMVACGGIPGVRSAYAKRAMGKHMPLLLSSYFGH